MSSKIVAILLFTLFAIPVYAGELPASNLIPPELTTAVTLSSSDINRIVCSGTVNDLIFSEEKGVDGHFAGNSAFVKFKISKQGEELSYATTPTELYVICNNAVYSLIATPEHIPAVTLRLAPAVTDRLKENVSRFQGLPFEKKVLQLIREASAGEFAESYRVTPAAVPVNLSADLYIKLYRIVEVEGIGLRLKEYSVRATAAGSTLQLDEKMFLTPEMGERIIAVAIEQHNLKPGEATRIFVVEQRGEES